MISIGAIKQSAKDAAEYYSSEEKNYYLSEKGVDQSTQWFGEGAKRNGILEKAVEPSELEMFLSGKTYDGEVSKSFKGELRRGWDFTLSAPKSVSILALIYGDKELIKAHDMAVKQTLQQIEKDAAQVRIFDNASQKMTFQNTGNMIAAMIRHSTSREMDPQLHTHNLICNISYDNNGKIRAMASCKEQSGDAVHGMSERVYRDQKYYTAIYQSTLAKYAVELGYKVRSVGNGQFEIEGVPQSVIAEFSKRRDQILDHAKSFNIFTSKGMDVATQATRKNKVFASLEELRSDWLSRHESFDIDKIKNNHDINHQIQIGDNTKKTVDLALSHLGRFQTKIRYEKLMEIALGNFAIDTGVDYKQCQAEIENKIQSGELIPLDKNASTFTTKTLLEKEKNLIITANTKSHHMSVDVNNELLNQLQLTTENRNKISSILESSKQVILIDIKGTSVSKKQIIESLVHLSENSKIPVKVISPNSIEKNQLGRLTERQSFTLSQWIKNKFKNDFHDTVNHYLNGEKNVKDKIIIVDQANRLGVDEITCLLQKSQGNHSKIIFLNDSEKIKSTKFGNSIETLKQADIHKISWINNRISKACVNISEIQNDKTRFEKLINEYASLSIDERLKTQVVSPNQKEAIDLNNQIRNALKSNGEIGRIEQTFNNLKTVFLSIEERQIIKNYQVGMTLKLFDENNNKSSKPKKFVITNIDKRNNTIFIKDENKETQIINLDTLYKKQFMIFQDEKMSIAKGDVIRPSSDMKKFGFIAGDQLLVKSVSFLGVNIQNQDGKSAWMAKNDFDGRSFQYDYAKSVSSVSLEKDRTILLIKSYAANDKVLNTLLDKTRSIVDIYTDDEKKIKTKLQRAYIQPTTINTVINAAEKYDETSVLEKFVNDKTTNNIKMDLESALSKIHENVSQTVVEKSVAFALSKTSEKEAAFRHQDLVKEALSFALTEEGYPIHSSQIEKELTALKKDGLLLSADYEDGVRWTTKESLLLEKSILKLIQDGKKQVLPLAEKDFVSKQLDNTSLTDSQKEAVFLITTTKDRFIAIQGLPGTGKSTMLSTVINIVNEAKKMTSDKVEFVGLAPTWQVVNELKEKGILAQTFASFLQELKSDSFDQEKYKNSVFLFDEASMACNRDKHDLLAAFNKSNTRAIDIGDIEQLQGQGSGKPFELAIKRGVIECVYLKDIIRQNPSTQLKMAVEDIIDKDVKSAFNRIENQHGFQVDGNKKTPMQDELLAALDKKNIIETYKKETGVSKLDSEKSKNEILVQGANEYLERTPESRKNSLFIAYSNRERDEFSYLVRESLTTEGTLNKESEMHVERLRPVNLTRAEMQTLDAYSQKSDNNKFILSFGKEKYYEVSDVDKSSKLITLTDVKTSETKTFNPLRSDHKNTQLWNQSTQLLAEGDLVVLRRADKDRGHISNVEYVVASCDKASKILGLKNSNETLLLDTKELKDCHWDYAYAKTSDMAQGSTKKFMVSMVHSQSSLTNIRRAIVDMSRASTHAMLITDKKDDLIQRLSGKTLQSVATNHGNKRSALDTIEKVIHPETRYFKNSIETRKINDDLSHNILKLDKYDDLVSIISKSNDVGKTIDSFKKLESNNVTSKQHTETSRTKSIDNIELEI